ncbi:MAG: hypothetical protein WHV44_12410 [Anaerolineales bacterium]
MPRPLELLDLPTIYRYRDNVVSLDYARLLTRGSPLGAAGLMSYFNPARHIYGAVVEKDDTPLLGGVIHNNSDSFARLYYLAPNTQLNAPELPDLIEHLAAEAGKWGAFHVTAEIDEGSDAYRALRLSGFSVYAWQRLWNLSGLSAPHNAATTWRRPSSADLPAMQSLHHQIVPALMHPFEQAPRHASGLTCCAEGLRGFVKISEGPYGIVLLPFIHPESNQVTEKLAALLNHLPDRRGRPVYLCVRSYQAWLEPVLEDLGATASERQAIMVKHLAHLVKDGQTITQVQSARVIPASHIKALTKIDPHPKDQ